MLQAKLFKPIDNSQLILFRMVFGLLLMIEGWGAILTGWVRKTLIEPKMNFPFFDFDFLHPLPGDGMIYYFLVMGAFGCMIMLGFKFRLAMIGYALLWAGVYFMQKTSYNNHYYLMVLLTFLFCFVPANCSHSIDVMLNPEIRRNYCPQWCIWLFKALVLIVYFYAAIAKLYPAWLQAIPIKIWFSGKADYWLIGDLLQQPWLHYSVAWGGIAYDLLIGPALLWKKTRKFAFAASIFFHLFNSVVFHIGIFPFMAIAFSILFFEPETIRSIFFKSKEAFDAATVKIQPKYRTPTTVFIVTFLSIQVLLPLRHWTIPGDVTWTEEGHRLSWRMMLRVKGGSVSMFVVDNTNEERFHVSLQNYLTDKQIRAIASRPDMLWYFVQTIKQEYEAKGFKDFSIFVEGSISLNGADAQPLYDPHYDLAKAEWKVFETNEWILKYDEP